MIQPHLGKLHRLIPLAAGLVAAAEGTAAQVRKIKRERRTSLRYKALGVGAGTPLWNELANAASPPADRSGESAACPFLLLSDQGVPPVSGLDEARHAAGAHRATTLQNQVPGFFLPCVVNDLDLRATLPAPDVAQKRRAHGGRNRLPKQLGL